MYKQSINTIQHTNKVRIGMFFLMQVSLGTFYKSSTTKLKVCILYANFRCSIVFYRCIVAQSKERCAIVYLRGILVLSNLGRDQDQSLIPCFH